MSEKKEKYGITLVYGLAVVMCAIVSFPILSQSVTGDEAFSIVLVRGSVWDIIKGSAADVHPPLYYLLLKLSTIIGGESILKYRIVTAVAFYINLLFIGATKIRKRWGKQSAVWYILWFGGAYYSFYVLMQIRMYTWGTLFATMAVLYLYEYYLEHQRKKLIICVLMTICAMYTHYYSLFVVFFAWVFYLFLVVIHGIKEKKTKLIWETLICGAIIVIGYLPWLGVMLKQTSTDKSYWTVYWRNLYSTPASIMQGSFPSIGMMLLVLAACVMIGQIKKEKLLIAYGSFICIMTELLGMLYSKIVTPIWAARYLYMSFGVFCLVLAACLGKKSFENKVLKLAKVILLGVLVMNIFSSVEAMRNEEVWTRKGYEWVDFIHNNVDKDATCFIGCLDDHKITFECYLPDREIYSFDTTDDGINDIIPKYLSEKQNNEKWLMIDSLMVLVSQEELVSFIENEGYDVNYVDTFWIKGKKILVYEII